MDTRAASAAKGETAEFPGRNSENSCDVSRLCQPRATRKTQTTWAPAPGSPAFSSPTPHPSTTHKSGVFDGGTGLTRNFCSCGAGTPRRHIRTSTCTRAPHCLVAAIFVLRSVFLTSRNCCRLADGDGDDPLSCAWRRRTPSSSRRRARTRSRCRRLRIIYQFTMVTFTLQS